MAARPLCPNWFNLQGPHRALVTGGSRGLGRRWHALARPARASCSARARPRIPEEAAYELQTAGIDARWIAADCAREEDIRRPPTKTVERMGPVDILVNNAGGRAGACPPRIIRSKPGTRS